MKEVIIIDNGNRYNCTKKKDEIHWSCSFKLRNGVEGDFTTPTTKGWAKTALAQACFQMSN